MRTYTQLTQEQRYQIYALKKMGHKPSQMARCLGVHKSTLSRELKRNSGLRGYRPQQAHNKVLERQAQKVSRRVTSETWALVEEKLRLDWSPEQISGWLKGNSDAQVSPPVITTQCIRTVTCGLHRDDWVNALGHEVECALHSVTNGSTITSMPTKAVVATCTNTCVARKSAVNVMAGTIDAGKSPIRSVSSNAPQSLRNENELAIGKQIRSLAKANGKRSRFGTPAGVRHLG